MTKHTFKIRDTDAKERWDESDMASLNSKEFIRRLAHEANTPVESFRLPVEINGASVWHDDDASGWVFFFTYPNDNAKPEYASYQAVYDVIVEKLQSNASHPRSDLMRLSVFRDLLVQNVSDAENQDFE